MMFSVTVSRIAVFNHVARSTETVTGCQVCVLPTVPHHLALFTSLQTLVILSPVLVYTLFAIYVSHPFVHTQISPKISDTGRMKHVGDCKFINVRPKCCWLSEPQTPLGMNKCKHIRVYLELTVLYLAQLYKFIDKLATQFIKVRLMVWQVSRREKIVSSVPVLSLVRIYRCWN